MDSHSKASKSDDDALRKLRAALDDAHLTPEQTADDIADPQESATSNDDNLKRDIPPHHGT